jgi:hypothetical protein
VLRIHDILVWIRIWIRESMPLTNGSGSCYFRHRHSRCQLKTNFLFYFFCLLLFEGTCTFFQKWEVKKSHKESQNSRNQGFSYYFCMIIEGSGSGRPKNMCGSGSATLVINYQGKMKLSPDLIDVRGDIIYEVLRIIRHFPQNDACGSDPITLRKCC